jgi:hypothetical protein
MASVIDQNEFYFIWDLLFMCCDEQQFRHQCKAHSELMGCYFCEFDYSKECECAE